MTAGTNTRHTLLVTSALARRQALLLAARERRHGLQVLTPAALAARLAGGFAESIDPATLQVAVRAALDDASLDLGDLEAIRGLPGMVRALVATLRRAWLAGIDLGAQAASVGPRSRLAVLHRLEAAVLERLPPGRLRPVDLVARADFTRAPALLGPVDVRGVPDLDPVWRPLVLGLAGVVPVSWSLGRVRAPAWLADSRVRIAVEPDNAPAVSRASCANPRHEALEALRWARSLLASGRARPEDILIAAPATHDWDDHLAVMAADANLPFAFVHGRPAMSTRDGQAAAALAEVLVKGLSRARVRRLLGLVRGMTPLTRDLPGQWHRQLPDDAPLLEVSRWERALEGVAGSPGGQAVAEVLVPVLRRLDAGPEQADEVGRALLSGRALALWQAALRDGPAEAIDVTLSGLRVDDHADPAACIAWCSAAEAAAAPRPFVRLLGLTSRGWPRTQSEDPLLPAHVLDPERLNPVPVPERDRRDFRNLLSAAGREIVLSRSRRDAEGRLNGASALLREAVRGSESAAPPNELYLRREAIPTHALSEADRCLARPGEFGQEQRARSARACWRDWHREILTAHDGLVRPDHPLLLRVLAERASASRLRLLARDPLGFVWRYALGWRAPPESDEPLALDALAFGSLVHRVLELALPALGPGGLAAATPEARAQAVKLACVEAAAAYEAQCPVPPRLMWRRTLDEAAEMAMTALDWPEEPLPGQRSWGEVPFGGAGRGGTAGEGADLPWDAGAEVPVPGTTLTVGGLIDRLDLSADGCHARVTDYKTGSAPKKEVSLGGGAELQRCLYASAVRALLGAETTVEARLLYLRDGGSLRPLEDPEATLAFLAPLLQSARDHVAAGHAVIGPDSGNRQDNELCFALPGNAKEVYLRLKLARAAERLEPLPLLWEHA